MRRLLLLLLVALLLPGAAHAQAPTATPAQADDPGVVDDPGDADEETGEDVGDDESTGDDEDFGGDDDYYNGCDPIGYGGDDDYYYCNAAAGEGNPRQKDGHPGGETTGGGEPQVSGATLPRTGDSPLLLALFGLGLLLAGTGGRLLTARR